MENNGRWVKLYSKIGRSLVFENESLLKLWIYILINANWEEKQVYDGAVLMPGQLAKGLRAIAEDLRWSKSKVERLVRTLERLGNIKTERRSGTLTQVITICNWKTYQQERDTSRATNRDLVSHLRRATNRDTSENTHLFINRKGRSTEEPSGDGLSPLKFMELWNSISGVQRIRNMSPSRTKALRQRLQEPNWFTDLEEALRKISDSDFCTGRNARGWRADVDWFLRPDSLTKVLEGKYDNNTSNEPWAPPPQHLPVLRADPNRRIYDEPT